MLNTFSYISMAEETCMLFFPNSYLFSLWSALPNPAIFFLYFMQSYCQSSLFLTQPIKHLGTFCWVYRVGEQSLGTNNFLGFPINISKCFIYFRFLRSVGYRWTTWWLCGYIGWGNTRPLPACVYHSIRTKYHSNQSRGYASFTDREWPLPKTIELFTRLSVLTILAATETFIYSLSICFRFE